MTILERCPGVLLRPDPAFGKQLGLDRDAQEDSERQDALGHGRNHNICFYFGC